LSNLLAGIDIGGTKCAVLLAKPTESGAVILDKVRFPTPPTPQESIAEFNRVLNDLLAKYPADRLASIGISCGGPLNSRTGMVLRPPNLPGWVNIDVVTPFKQMFHVPAAVMNDANACALAEWMWGAGKGLDNVVFLTFGTGMGAGLILDGRLYAGTCDLGGEVGHLRLSSDGPLGFGKHGSFEGWCSGGGIARYAQDRARQAIEGGSPPAYCPTLADLDTVTAASVAQAVHAGDPLARDIFDTVARKLGEGLAYLVDILNPQRIIIGSIFGRQRDLLEPLMWESLKAEAIAESLAVCDVVPAGLGEQVGDFASLAIAAGLLKTPSTD
jgi:glucokinase